MSDEDERLPPDMQEFERQLLDNMVPEEKLLAAAQSGHGPVVKDLLLQGTPILVNENGTTALHQAAQSGFADVVRILLDHGADIDTPDSEGYTALHKAAERGHLDVLGLLINEGCQIDLQDQTYGNTALHEAAWKGFSKSVDLLLKNKSNAFIANRAGCTALHLAAQSGHNQSGRALIYAGCSPDVKNNYGDTPLHTAARYGHAGIARILISARCSASEQNKNGDTSLHIAAAFKRRKIATLLVEGGINVQLVNKQGETATDIARRKDHSSIIEIIHRGHAQPTAGVRLRSASDLSKTQSSQQTISREATPEVSRDNKKKSGLVSWIKRKFAKEKLEKERLGRSLTNLNKPGDEDDGNLGLFSQYVKRQGFAYYRDLAGNIRQGPVGYVPNCHCEASKRTSILDPLLDYNDSHVHMGTLNHHKLSERMKSLDRQNHYLGPDLELATRARLLAEKQECLERLRKLNEQERLRHVDQEEAMTKDDLHSWLATQISESKESDPFGYSIGTKQQRFGDDFDHERIARYEAIHSEQFPPPPRLFRSRSDETLTHSEYSFHGRAFKSREAAMEELKILKHHSEIRERRKLIRAGLKEQELRAKQANRIHSHFSHANPTDAGSKRKSALWMSKEDLNEENPKNEKSKPTEICMREKIDGHLHGRDSKKESIEGSVCALKNQTQPARVMGRRERSVSPERKPAMKTSVVMPLKSAMRQPRRESSSEEKTKQMYRSNSLPRDTRIEFKKENSDNNGPKKTVRYDETVKSTEIAQDMPPSISPAQAEEVFLPAKREAPIGGHDEKYSENTLPVLPAYQKPTDEAQPKDLRDSIVNARKQLLARKPEVIRTSDKQHENYKTGMLDRHELIKQNSLHPQGNRRLHSESQVGRRQHNEPPANSRSFYHSQDALRPTQKPALPFSHYANSSQSQHVHQNQSNQLYSSASLSRPAKQPIEGHKNSSNTNRRMPLPSYEEIQSNRMGIRMSGNASNQMRMPPNYQRKFENSNSPNLANGTPVPQPIPSAQQPPRYYKPNQRVTGINNGQINGHAISSNQHEIQQSVSVPHLTTIQRQPSTLTNQQRQIGRSNSMHNSTSNQMQHYNNTQNRQLLGDQQQRVGIASYQQHMTDEVATDLTSTNNTGSCSSSNPDSGYSGNFYDTNSNSITSSTDYNTWYQQSIQSAALKMTAMTENRPVSRGVPQQPENNKNIIHRGKPQTGRQRTVYTNLTSDV
ncbi:uncharacterized protein [Watersipora subatra]